MTPLRLIPVLLVWLVALCSVTAAARAATLTTKGLAPVRLGATIAGAERALHARLGRLSRSSHGFSTEPEATEICWLWQRRDGRDAHITYMTERGRIVRIDVTASSGTAIPTTRGIAVGSRLDAVEKAYGADLHLEPHPLDEPTRWAVVERDGAAAIRIEVTDGAVSAMFAATGPALDYSEGCS